jgi:hypothetical protein
VEEQIAALPYREPSQGKKNGAGWLIAAIERNYALPAAYLEEQEKRRQAVKAEERGSTVARCPLCDENGWRRIKSEQHPLGAMKRCSHDAGAEARYTDA